MVATESKEPSESITPEAKPPTVTLPTGVRDWKSIDGKTLRASLEGVSEDGLTGNFKREDGKIFTIPKERLSEEDRSYFEGLAD